MEGRILRGLLLLGLGMMMPWVVVVALVETGLDTQERNKACETPVIVKVFKKVGCRACVA
jgi:hypothetical protein